MFFLTCAPWTSAEPNLEGVAILDETLNALALSEPTKAAITQLLPNKSMICVSDILGLNSHQIRDSFPRAYEEIRQTLLRKRNLSLDLQPFEIEEYRQTGRIVDATPQSRIERLELRKLGIQELRRIGIKQIFEINNITNAEWASMKWESAKLQIPKAVARMESRLRRRLKIKEAPVVKPVKVPPPILYPDMDPPLRRFVSLRNRGLLTIAQLQGKSERWFKANFDRMMSRRLIDLIRSVGDTYLDELEVAIAEEQWFRPINAHLMNISEDALERLGHPVTVGDLLKIVDALDAKSPQMGDQQIKRLKTRIALYRAGCNRSLREAAE